MVNLSSGNECSTLENWKSNLELEQFFEMKLLEQSNFSKSIFDIFFEYIIHLRT